jgi:hypothetical protein
MRAALWRSLPTKRPTSATRITATITPMTNASQPLEIAAATIIDADANGKKPPHRVASRVQETPESTHEGSDDDEPDPVHDPASSWNRWSGHLTAFVGAQTPKLRTVLQAGTLLA